MRWPGGIGENEFLCLHSARATRIMTFWKTHSNAFILAVEVEAAAWKRIYVDVFDFSM